jgi:hypothetical protein
MIINITRLSADRNIDLLSYNTLDNNKWQFTGSAITDKTFVHVDSEAILKLLTSKLMTVLFSVTTKYPVVINDVPPWSYYFALLNIPYIGCYQVVHDEGVEAPRSPS